ncbi:hypothetical protein ASN88_00833 [Streptococcus parauberis]|nr:hypothetical protein ASN88_00833 [Streptococcus parauberis]
MLKNYKIGLRFLCVSLLSYLIDLLFSPIECDNFFMIFAYLTFSTGAMYIIITIFILHFNNDIKQKK